MKVFAVLVTICFLCAAISASSLKQLMRDEWNGFKLEHRKVYDSLTEEQYRLNVYLDNREFIAQHNQRYAMGLETYELGLNHLADRTYEEVLQQFAGYNSTEINFDLEDGYDDSDLWLQDDTKLGAFDWRQKLTLGHVKNQRDCGSCWAFTALTAIEHHLRIHKKVLIDLSEQQLIDCSRSYGNGGCNGGLMDNAFKYIMKEGITKEVTYPYVARDGKSCKYQKSMKAVTIKGFKEVQGEASMQQTLEHVGPLSVAIHASREFTLYKSGVFNQPSCPKALNHAVVIIGHGQEGNNQYWIVQNSWGQAWGEKGYILMSKNKDNQCGINTIVSYPIV